MNFVDTGAFLAYHRKNDQYHREARRLWPSLAGNAVTSNHIMDELATGLGRIAGYAFAVECVALIYSSPGIRIFQSTREDELEALAWMRKFADQGVSFTDCISFAIMRRHKVQTAFTFDRHFQLAGFNVIGLK
jgi:uncharacterized protein